MSKQTAQLLEDFDALPFDSGPLDDGETALAADQLFSQLDVEEDDTATR